MFFQTSTQSCLPCHEKYTLDLSAVLVYPWPWLTSSLKLCTDTLVSLEKAMTLLSPCAADHDPSLPPVHHAPLSVTQSATVPDTQETLHESGLSKSECTQLSSP